MSLMTGVKEQMIAMIKKCYPEYLCSREIAKSEEAKIFILFIVELFVVSLERWTDLKILKKK